jgi:hypothetical protein
MMTIYIGTAKDYREGDRVEEKVFYTDLQLAKEGAQMRAKRAGALFGMVYEVSRTSDGTVRSPNRVTKFVDWSI